MSDHTQTDAERHDWEVVERYGGYRYVCSCGSEGMRLHDIGAVETLARNHVKRESPSKRVSFLRADVVALADVVTKITLEIDLRSDANYNALVPTGKTIHLIRSEVEALRRLFEKVDGA